MSDGSMSTATAIPPAAESLTAAALDAAARWVDDQLAGGAPAKWVATQAAVSLRWIAGQARAGWPQETVPGSGAAS